MIEPRFTAMNAAIVFAGAGAGGVLRFAMHGLIRGSTGDGFPWATLLVNASGCVGIGVLMALWAAPAVAREEYRLALMVGVLGGYTTFSAFGRDSIMLVQNGHPGRAIAYVAASVAGSLAAVVVGMMIGRFLRGDGAAPAPH